MEDLKRLMQGTVKSQGSLLGRCEAQLAALIVVLLEA